MLAAIDTVVKGGGGGFRERPVGMAYSPTNMAAQKCGENYFLEVENDRWDGSI